ncbi:MAG: winged helix-turn-helix domain-containing protein [Candidatus Njordarchaeota archaeon]
MPTIHIKLKLGDTEIEIKADGELDKDTLNTIKGLLAPITASISKKPQENNIENTVESPQPSSIHKTSIYSTFKETISSVFKYGQWFTSSDAREAFYDLYGTLLKQSTVSTYLRRMEKEGILLSKRYGKIIKFRLSDELCVASAPIQQKKIIEPF